jgi:hypothetical protein
MQTITTIGLDIAKLRAEQTALDAGRPSQFRLLPPEDDQRFEEGAVAGCDMRTMLIKCRGRTKANTGCESAMS